ncbi:MAG: hypothetical protein ABI679_01365 [Gemmatimonadota bacterium]
MTRNSMARTSVFVALIAGPLLSGCAITLNLPANRFESPETQGSQGLYLEAGVSGANKVVLVPSISASPPDVNSPAIVHENSGAAFGGGVGIVPRLDLGVHFNGNAPTVFRAKYQFIGSGRSTTHAGIFSLAVSAGIGASKRDDSYRDTFSSTQGASTTKFITYDGSIIAGYRFSSSMLLYGSVFYTTTDVDGTITQTPTNNVAQFRGDARQKGANLGIELNTGHLGLIVEGGYGNATYKVEREDGAFLGALFRIYSGRIH